MNRKSTLKLDTIKNIEISKQKSWEDEKIFESSPDFSSNEKNKYMVTFPYPYMNGSLHLGHAFSLSKCEFSMGYERLKGKNTLWGFGLHCTGMPIKSSADKLRREMDNFGFPPVFPVENNEVKEIEVNTEVIIDKSKGKKSKAVAKSGGFKYQWQIMRNNGMSDDEIKKFTDTNYWIQYYPPMTIDHMKRMGIKVDWRRSFITTDLNPFYDSFVRWQFLKLKKLNKIMFGKRQTIFSPADKQPCMDHDRSSGEGVGPQEYTLIKLQVEKPYPSCVAGIEGDIFFLAATLRPETIYGVTNCWVHPDIEYVAVESAKHGVLVCVERAARNMAYQEILSNNQGEMKIVRRFKGQELIGCGLKTPMSKYDKIYTLPMLTIKQSKGTGVVMSVPSDSPDDFAALRDLKTKEPMRKKFGVSDEHVLPFEPVEIIEIPEYGTLCAPKCVDEMKIRSQNDTEKLMEAKEKCYKLGFYNGILLMGKHAGLQVQKAKELITADLIGEGQAIKYSEPEKLVMSRSGDECVVALCDQWYLNYKDAEWKSLTKTCLDQVNTYSEEVRRNFEATLDNLHEYACSRSYGLGTRIPWDEQYLVESLSDSTIYMAYYTVAHLLQGDSLDGRSGNNKAGLRSDDMSPDAWEYVLGEKSSVEALIGEEMRSKLDVLRSEFLYWYPVDLRVSGKDLVPNHLTYYLYNHCAIWPNNQDGQYWPKSVRANGHLLLNNEKMAKSTGNFLTVTDAIEKYSADGMRMALCDSGDTIEDANFVEAVADSGVLRLYSFLEWAKEVVETRDQMRTGPLTLHSDRIFENAINRTIGEVDGHYREMMFKRVLQVAFHELQSARDRYRETSLGSFHGDLIMRFIEVQCLLLSPICPHLTDYIWTEVLGKPRSILHELWPVAGPVDETLSKEEFYLDKIAHEFRTQSLHKPRGKSEPHNAAVIFIARSYPPWQLAILDTLIEMSADGLLPDNKLLNQTLARLPGLKPRMQKAMDFIQMVRKKTDERADKVVLLKTPEIDERAVIIRNLCYMERTLNLEMGRLEIRYSTECTDEKLFDSCCPMEPKIMFVVVPVCAGPDQLATRVLSVVNPQLHCGMMSCDVEVHDGDSAMIVVRKIAENAAIEDFSSLSLYRFKDGKAGQSLLPSADNVFGLLEKVDFSSKFTVTSDGFALSTNGNSVDIGDKMKYFVEKA